MKRCRGGQRFTRTDPLDPFLLFKWQLRNAVGESPAWLHAEEGIPVAPDRHIGGFRVVTLDAVTDRAVLESEPPVLNAGKIDQVGIDQCLFRIGHFTTCKYNFINPAGEEVVIGDLLTIRAGRKQEPSTLDGSHRKPWMPSEAQRDGVGFFVLEAEGHP